MADILTSVLTSVLTFDGVSIEHQSRGRARSRILHDVSFSIAPGEAFGLVGESGCGKSTTSAMVMRLLDSTSGSIRFKGTELTTVPACEFARSPLRRELQMVFQDPHESLNPRATAAQSIPPRPKSRHCEN